MKINRVLTKGLIGPVATSISWKRVDCLVQGEGGEVIFRQDGVEVPAQWSQNAANILASKYFRRAGVPESVGYVHEDDATPLWLRRSRPSTQNQTFGGETSARDVFYRMAGCWSYWGWREGLLTTEEDARAFYDELFAMLAAQVAAPNSPQWFNTGLYWAYGIEGPDSGQWYVSDLNGGPPDADSSILPGGFGLLRSHNSYERPQPHACFLSSVDDDLVNEGGIMDLWTREARIFKYGSGSGVNPSRIRAKGEALSGGGKSSGMMSFLEVGDRSAGAIHSGGTTRRAAKLICPDIDHPEIEEFIGWKSREEHKAASMSVGSRVIAAHLNAIAENSVLDAGLPFIADMRKMLVGDALDAGVPQSLIDRALTGEKGWVEYDLGWESEAIRTVSGQNANNSPRVTDAFMLAVETDADWNLTARTDGSVMKTIKARELWEKLCYSTWASGDPGVIFHGTVNAWNTCSADGEIRTANPCVEYNFLDDTACNLASLRLTAFRRSDGTLDLDLFEHACRLWTIVLDISVEMASFPSKEFALGAYNYRTLGLGHADGGGLLMRMGLPYDSDEGRSLLAGLTALMTGVAYRTSAEMAAEVGPFPRWEANAESMRRVLRNHRHALYGQSYEDAGLPAYVWLSTHHEDLYARCEQAWAAACLKDNIFRNAQTTLIAPTGTISFVMDCDTFGVEPDYALVKHKHLAGGGTMQIVNQCVPDAVRSLGYDEGAVEAFEKNIASAGNLKGFAWRELWHERVFDCVAELRPMAHVLMLAALQPFLSGAASKTANLPNSATVDDVRSIYEEAYRLGVKAIAPFRDGSKMTQPLSFVRDDEVDTSDIPEADEGWFKRMSASEVPVVQLAERSAHNGQVAGSSPAGHTILSRGAREYLPWRRDLGFTQKAKLGDEPGQTIFWRVSEFPDGRPGEVFIELAHEGSTLRATANSLAIALSVALQHGTPLESLVDKFIGTKFEPAGYVEGHDRIKFASSFADLIARDLAITYLGRDDLAEVALAPAVDDPQKVVALDRRALLAAASGSRMTGDHCPGCGGLLVTIGTSRCKYCSNCGYNTGCG